MLVRRAVGNQSVNLTLNIVMSGGRTDGTDGKQGCNTNELSYGWTAALTLITVARLYSLVYY